MARGRSRGRGRVRIHERDTNDVPILGASIEVQEGHQRSVENTEDHEKKDKTRRDHRNRLKAMYEWWKDEYPEYYSVGVKEMTDADLAIPSNFYHKNKHDLIYTGLNPTMVKAFLASKKIKSNGKTASHSHLRKYHDAILWGAKIANQPLPPSYYMDIEKFLDSFKKETAKAKKEGNTDEHEADPISWTLYQLICGWALKRGNIFVWVWTVLQWNCMARSISIDPLGLHNFTLGDDNIKVKYDSSKSDLEM